MAATLIDTFAPAVSGGTGVQHWSEAVTGGTVHTMVAIGSNGIPQGISSTMVPSGVSAQESQVAITTVGAGTLTAAALLSGDILRSGPTSAFTDTTDTAALLQAAWVGNTGSSFEFTYNNTTAFAATLAGGTGITLSGNLIVPQNQWARFLVVWTGASTATIYYLSGGHLNTMPRAKYTTSSVTTGSIAQNILTGADFCVWEQTGATPGAQLVRTAAQMLADQPNGRVGMNWRARIINDGAGTLTLTTDAGSTVTLTGTMTVAQNTWRDFLFTIVTATTATCQSIGTGTQS